MICIKQRITSLISLYITFWIASTIIKAWLCTISNLIAIIKSSKPNSLAIDFTTEEMWLFQDWSHSLSMMFIVFEPYKIINTPLVRWFLKTKIIFIENILAKPSLIENPILRSGIFSSLSLLVGQCQLKHHSVTITKRIEYVVWKTKTSFIL